jgi:hypothetical protein
MCTDAKGILCIQPSPEFLAQVQHHLHLSSFGGISSLLVDGLFDGKRIGLWRRTKNIALPLRRIRKHTSCIELSILPVSTLWYLAIWDKLGSFELEDLRA